MKYASRANGAAPSSSTRRSGLIDTVVARLRRKVLDGTWPVGTKIPPEPELTELTGAGRNTVREAVQSLVHAGLLERRQGSGTYVISSSEFAVVMGRQIAGARHRDVLELRRMLEIGAARLSAQQRTVDDIAELRELQKLRVDAAASGDVGAVVKADSKLHVAIARSTGNPVFADFYEDFLEAIAENIRMNFLHPAHIDDSHEGLVSAIIAGNVDVAVVEAAEYLDRIIEVTGG